jgi:hypothetical protein
MKTKKENRQIRKSLTAEGKNALAISSKPMADLKNKGILAFKQMTDEEQKKVWEWSREVIQQYRIAYKDIGTFQRIHDAEKKELQSRVDPKRRASKQNDEATYPLSDKYTELIVSEQKALLQEISDFIIDLESIMQGNRSGT